MTNQTQPSPAEINRELAQREHDRNTAFHTYANEAAIKSGEIAIRMALLINGAAAIALLTFIGTLPKEQKTLVAGTLAWFAYGVAAGATALALSYFTNYFMVRIAGSKVKTWDQPYVIDGPTTRRYTVLNIICHTGAVFTGVAALILFVCGVLDVRNVLGKLI